jgi:hypothetical protein
MGRDFYIVVVRNNLQHEKGDNKHCISLDHEPDNNEKIKIEDNLFQSKYRDCKDLDELDEKHKDDFCQLCRWYLEPACYKNKYVVCDNHHIVLPSFRGNYFMEEFLYPRDIAYDYCQEGGSVYWITQSDVQDMEERVNDVSPPKRNSDVKQFEQTKETLKVLQEWICKDNVKVLYFTEY